MRNTFKKNIQFLPANLKSRVLELTENELNKKIDIVFSNEGYPICIYKEGKLNYHITSIKPLEEAKRWCDHFLLEDTGALFVYGCGFGYPLLEILKRKEPNTIIVVYEQNIYLFAVMLYYFDLEPIFKTQKFKFFVGDAEDFFEEFHRLFFTDVFLYVTAPYIAFTPTAQRNFKDKYLEIHTYIFNALCLNVFYLGNDHYDTLLGFHNLIANIKEVINNPYLSILKDKYKNVPAFIISNGPSLDKNIHELKQIKEKGLIISTESAIVPLTKNDITPDILCVVERIEEAFRYHFKGRKYSENISLLALTVIDKNIFPAFNGPKIPIFRNTESINRWINSIIGDKESELDAGANVSHLAFELAVYLGANPVILVGQDFAFSPDGSTHSKDSAYYEDKKKENISRIKAKPVVYVESNEGNEIPTTQLWLDFKAGLERKIISHPSINVINATEGGAKIQGTTCDKLYCAIENYCKESIRYRVNSIIKKNKKEIDIEERKQKIALFISELNKYAEKFHELSQVAVNGILRSRKMLELIEKADINQFIEKFEQGYEENFNDLKKFMNDNLYYVFLQQVLLTGFHKMNRLGNINSLERVKNIYTIYEELFHNLNIVCQSVAINYEMAIEKIYTDNNIP